MFATLSDIKECHAYTSTLSLSIVVHSEESISIPKVVVSEPDTLI